MKKIVKKTTTEEFKDGKLIKRVIEEITEETNDTEKLEPLKVGDSTPPWDKKFPRTWTTADPGIALLSSEYVY